MLPGDAWRPCNYPVTHGTATHRFCILCGCIMTVTVAKWWDLSHWGLSYSRCLSVCRVVLYSSPYCIALVSLGDFSTVEIFSQGHKFTHFDYFSFSNPYQKSASPFLCMLLFPPKPCQNFKLPAWREIPASALPYTSPHCMFFYGERREPKKNLIEGGGGGGGGSCGPKIGSKSPQDRENPLMCARL